jgi:DNA repair exonuclease SbcCD ATPase subunit
MPLPARLQEIRLSIQERKKTTKKGLSDEENLLLHELTWLDGHLDNSDLSHMRMTGPSDEVCPCCGQPLKQKK